jgi:hypothetical protein
MSGMSRRSAVFVAAIAVLFAALPLMHQHPLGTESAVASGSSCVACVAGANRIPDAPAVVTAPQLIVFALSAPVVSLVATGVTLLLPSRAPPAV